MKSSSSETLLNLALAMLMTAAVVPVDQASGSAVLGGTRQDSTNEIRNPLLDAHATDSAAAITPTSSAGVAGTGVTSPSTASADQYHYKGKATSDSPAHGASSWWRRPGSNDHVPLLDVHADSSAITSTSSSAGVAGATYPSTAAASATSGVVDQPSPSAFFSPSLKDLLKDTNEISNPLLTHAHVDSSADSRARGASSRWWPWSGSKTAGTAGATTTAGAAGATKTPGVARETSRYTIEMDHNRLLWVHGFVREKIRGMITPFGEEIHSMCYASHAHVPASLHDARVHVHSPLHDARGVHSPLHDAHGVHSPLHDAHGVHAPHHGRYFICIAPGSKSHGFSVTIYDMPVLFVSTVLC